MNNEVAQRYADGLFELAKQENKVEIYMEQVQLLLDTMQQNPDLKYIFQSIKISKEEKRNFVEKIYKNSVDHYVLNFIKLMIDKGRSNYLTDVYTCFITLCEEELGIEHATIISARKLSEADINTIGNTLVSKTNKRMIIENKIDPSVIAGIKVIMGNTVTDITMKTKIETMRNQLLKGGNVA